MEPRFFERGNLATAPKYRLATTSLQWSRAFLSAEMRLSLIQSDPQIVGFNGAALF